MKHKKFKLIIMSGLPGSGKTTMANKLHNKMYANHQWCRIIPFDECLAKDPNASMQRIIAEYCYGSIYVGETVILDGLFLTNSTRAEAINSYIKFIEGETSFKNNEYDVTIYHFNENRENCLHNDKGRRNVASTITIMNAAFEDVDVDYIAKRVPDVVKSIDVKLVDVIKATEWQKHFEPYFDGGCTTEGFLDSESWSCGGSWGDCWGNSGTISAETPLEFVEFDELLEKICPNISFLQYKLIKNDCVSLEEHVEYDYYGGSETTNFWRCDMRKLYDVLTDRGLLVEE